MKPPSCYPFPKDDAAMYNRDDEDKQRQPKRRLETLEHNPKAKRTSFIRRTLQNQKQITGPIKGHLTYNSDGTRPECTVCKYIPESNRTCCLHGRTFCQHGYRELPETYIPVIHFQKNQSSIRRHPPIYPQYFHVVDDAEASSIFLTYLDIKNLLPPNNRAELITIFEEMQDPYDHPLNSNGTFHPIARSRCTHQDNRGTDCTRMALIKETPFCFEHIPAPIKRKFLPPPELEGSPEEQDLTKFVFWMQSRGGTDKDWSTKTNKERKKILGGSAQRLKISLQHKNILKGNKDNFTWL